MGGPQKHLKHLKECSRKNILLFPKQVINVAGGLLEFFSSARKCLERFFFVPQEYMDPMNEHNALNEARQMIAVADENQNHSLELEEILKYSEYFTGSKLMDYARNVHEEF